jgi:hypothetical protein
MLFAKKETGMKKIAPSSGQPAGASTHVQKSAGRMAVMLYQRSAGSCKSDDSCEIVHLTPKAAWQGGQAPFGIFPFPHMGLSPRSHTCLLMKNAPLTRKYEITGNLVMISWLGDVVKPGK